MDSSGRMLLLLWMVLGCFGSQVVPPNGLEVDNVILEPFPELEGVEQPPPEFVVAEEPVISKQE